MSTVWSKEGDIADLYQNVLVGDHADSTEVIIGNEIGDYIICFSDTGHPFPSTERTAEPSI